VREKYSNLAEVLNNQASKFSEDIEAFSGRCDKSANELQDLKAMLFSTAEELRTEQECLRRQNESGSDEAQVDTHQQIEALRTHFRCEIETLRKQQLQTKEILAQDVGAIKDQLLADVRRLGSASEIAAAIQAECSVDGRGGYWSEEQMTNCSQSFMTSERMSTSRTPCRTPSKTSHKSAGMHSGVSCASSSPSLLSAGDPQLEGTFIEDMLGQLRNDVDSVQSNVVKLRNQNRQSECTELGCGTSFRRMPSVTANRSACLPVAVGIGKR